jgi:hypothetical protein
MREVSYEKLLSKIDYVWNKKDDIRSLLKTRVPELQKLLKESIELTIARLLK